MALFSLLLALLLDRIKVVKPQWSDRPIHAWVAKQWLADHPSSQFRLAAAVLAPSVVVYLLLSLVGSALWGVIGLLIWCAAAVALLNHLPIRNHFSGYLKAARRGDSQACYHYAQQLDPHTDINSIDSAELGRYIGQTVAWLNYRYFAAVVIYFALFGPVGGLLYSSLRYHADRLQLSHQCPSWLSDFLAIADWAPSRLLALGYMLSGHFTSAMPVWQRYAVDWQTPARTVIGEVALAAEHLPNTPNDSEEKPPICVESTLALLKLARRNFILLLVFISLLTIFGVIA
ncbi:beta-lactamase regulator AmpE [Paraferrimonas sedimenticola]|uniref:Beta-lactamase regulator AmpE n=1 Tax=Paraferrimonas sedimenticola TaxID=375674 RepID=A0AA37RXF1_9GAMM|nr:beta-lactamase regulator AmpE [Paraferrimonas sedimenticola]GLP97460.1 beta-lactamase regulator AmpE [Paraferrimonas sedimenticola]